MKKKKKSELQEESVFDPAGHISGKHLRIFLINWDYSLLQKEMSAKTLSWTRLESWSSVILTVLICRKYCCSTVSAT